MQIWRAVENAVIIPQLKISSFSGSTRGAIKVIPANSPLDEPPLSRTKGSGGTRPVCCAECARNPDDLLERERRESLRSTWTGMEGVGVESILYLLRYQLEPFKYRGGKRGVVTASIL
ncbi:hypothetical protein CEXT_25021 [Caerostris extrusa]|uniref:Uncharacterized protein n=1 Tax=Caerostris extrusa TaxID=172846 RepID=A0AAV4TI65_CAEEX|nr:hypothetical protein CEXT_25021 [Caerostris extrusa]